MLCKRNTGSISLKDRYLTWVISKFHSLPLQVGVEIQSPQFVYRDVRYTLAIWPRGLEGASSIEWFGICLYQHNGTRSTKPVQFSIVNNHGTVKTCMAKCSENNNFKEEHFMTWSDFSDLIYKITPNNCLVIVCRLPVEKNLQESIKSDDIMEMLTCSMNDSCFKFQSGNYRSRDTVPSMSSLMQDSSYSWIPGSDHGFPSAANSNFSISSPENSHEIERESSETESQDFKMPCNVRNPANSQNAFWRFFKRGSSQTSEANQPGETSDPIGSIPENATTEQAQDCATLLPEDTNSSQFLNSSESNSSASTEEKDSQNNNNLQDLVASSALHSDIQKTDQVAEPSSSADHCPKGHKILSQHLKNIYLQGKIFDLTIIMEGREFKVLKIILSRSPVFKKLFAEDSSNIICITPFDSCDSSNFHDFLLYIYSGEVDLSHRNVFGLYSAACKFEVPDLKEECIQFLRQSLSIGTVTDILRLINNESDLLEEAIFFLAKNLDLIMGMDEWIQFMRDDPKRVAKFQCKAMQVGFQKVI